MSRLEVSIYSRLSRVLHHKWCGQMGVTYTDVLWVTWGVSGWRGVTLKWAVGRVPGNAPTHLRVWHDILCASSVDILVHRCDNCTCHGGLFVDYHHKIVSVCVWPCRLVECQLAGCLLNLHQFAPICTIVSVVTPLCQFSHSKHLIHYINSPFH